MEATSGGIIRIGSSKMALRAMNPLIGAVLISKITS
jgi:hypothetical protein